MDRKRMGRKMIALRGARTREEAAEGIGISVSALTMYELGRRTPRDEIKMRIAEYYGVCVGGLFFYGELHETCERKGERCEKESEGCIQDGGRAGADRGL